VKRIIPFRYSRGYIYVKVSEDLKTIQEKKLGTQTVNARRDSCYKMACPDMIVMPDVALDPYSIYGHDGIIKTAM
jgi:porphobilinogen synthase